MLNRKQVSLNPIEEPHKSVLFFFGKEPVFSRASGIASLPYPMSLLSLIRPFTSEQLHINPDSLQPPQMCWSNWALLHQSWLVLGSIYMGRSEETSVWLALGRAGGVRIRCYQPASGWDVILNPALKHRSCSHCAYVMCFFWELWEILVQCWLFRVTNIIWCYLQTIFLSRVESGSESLGRNSPLHYVTWQWWSSPGFFLGWG